MAFWGVGEGRFWRFLQVCLDLCMFVCVCVYYRGTKIIIVIFYSCLPVPTRAVPPALVKISSSLRFFSTIYTPLRFIGLATAETRQRGIEKSLPGNVGYVELISRQSQSC